MASVTSFGSQTTRQLFEKFHVHVPASVPSGALGMSQSGRNHIQRSVPTGKSTLKNLSYSLL